MGRQFKKDRLYVYIQLIHFGVQQKVIQLWKTTIPQLKNQHTDLGLTNVLLCITRYGCFESLSQQFLNLFSFQRTRQHT